MASSDWKTPAIVVLGATVAGAWLFYLGLAAIRNTRTGWGIMLMALALLVVAAGRLWAGKLESNSHNGNGPPGSSIP